MAIHSSILVGESHGQRSLVGYNPLGCKKLDTTEQLTHTFINEYILFTLGKRMFPLGKKKVDKTILFQQLILTLENPLLFSFMC